MGTLAKARDIVKKLAFEGFKQREPVIVKDLPDEWSDFGAIEGDRIIRIKIPAKADATGCMYYAPKGGVFPLHSHPSVESAIVLGSCSITTYKGTKTYHYGSTFEIEAELLHSVNFLEDTLLIVTWTPRFHKDEWEAGLPAAF
jgi:quercetin dioxygenase-like cupin family protein